MTLSIGFGLLIFLLFFMLRSFGGKESLEVVYFSAFCILSTSFSKNSERQRAISG